jgi:hypothetical protein
MSERIQKVIPPVTETLRLSLNSEEMNRSLALANITSNYQRPDEELIAAMKKKQKQRRAAAVVDNTCLHDTSQSSEVTPANALSTTPAPTVSRSTTAPSKQQKKSSDWETEAQRIIERADLSLDKDWSRISWKQKASNIVRLKLLQNDGYDITPLLAKPNTADQIIDALLAHIESRKQRQQASAVAVYPRSDTQSEAEEEATNIREKINPLLHGSNNTQHHSVPYGTLYPSSSLLSQKRKHTHEDDTQPEWHESHPQTHLHTTHNQDRLSKPHPLSPCTCGPSRRKTCRPHSPHRTEQKIQEQASHMLKRQITRSLFTSVRAAQTTPSHVHQTTSNQVQNHIIAPLPSPQAPPFFPSPCPSRILFSAHEAPGMRPSGSHAYISSAAFDLICREIQWLSLFSDAQDGSSYWICDCEAQDHEPRDIGPAEQFCKHGIQLCLSGGRSVVLEGASHALAALMRYLRLAELGHLGRYRVGDVREDERGVRDVEMKILYNEFLPFHLSPAVDQVLSMIEKRLGGGDGSGGGDEVRIGVVRQHARFRVI